MPPSEMPTTRNVVMFLASNGLPAQLEAISSNTRMATTTADTALGEILSGMFPPGERSDVGGPGRRARPEPDPTSRLLQVLRYCGCLMYCECLVYCGAAGTSVLQVVRWLRDYWMDCAATAGSMLTVA